MMYENGYTEILRISGMNEAEQIVALLCHSEVKCKVVQNIGVSAQSGPPSSPSTIIKVPETDRHRALALVESYQNSKGVPLS